MKLKLENIISEKDKFENAGIRLPEFNIYEMRQYTESNPEWIHFGAGNIFRGYIAKLQQTLLDRGIEKSGIIAAECFDTEIIDKIYKPYDNLVLFAGLRKDGSIDKQVIASIAEGVKGGMHCEDDKKRLVNIFESDKLRMVSFTITEKGYSLYDMNGSVLKAVSSDIENGPENCIHMMSIITSLMYKRFLSGRQPVALVSMDNCSHNGDRLKQSVLFIAEKWIENGYADKQFIPYLLNESKVAFPLSMIDKITPRPDADVERALAELGVEALNPITTGRNTYIAPFVNAEIPEYLVIEDKFPNGRQKLEEAGVYFTYRETVDKAEKMKVTTCLNPLHTALAIFGCLLSYSKISDEMDDEDLKLLVERLGYNEGLPVAVNPGIIDPKSFLDEVICERLPNPFMPDTPQRIATDTSQKIPIRYGITIQAYEKTGRVSELEMIPLVIAGWLRYLLGKDDELNDMPLSPDPMMDELKYKLKDIRLDKTNLGRSGQTCLKVDLNGVRDILRNKTIFTVDIMADGMNKKIEELFLKMLEGKGAVRKVLHESVI